MSLAAAAPKPKPLSAADVERRVRELLRTVADDRALRTEFEGLARQPAFPGLTWLWGPELYRRQRVLFRPFILSYFSSWQFDPPWTWRHTAWKGETADRLEAWFRECDERDDHELFRRLYQWKLTPTVGWRPDTKPLVEDLRRRLAAASTPASRTVVLQKFDLWFELDEPTAVDIYRRVGPAAGPFLLKHLSVRFSWWGGSTRELWKDLHAAAVAAGDGKTADALFRRQAPLEAWEAEALAACDRIRDPEALSEHLGRIHPEGWGLDLGKPFVRLLERRGMDLWPYVRGRLFQVQPGLIFRSGYDDLLDLARRKEWWPLWAGLMRSSAPPAAFNREIRALADDTRLPEAAVRERLRLLAGVGWELNLPGLGIARLAPLDDETAVRLYDRFPDLVQGAFRAHLFFTSGLTYPKTIARLRERGDDDLVDHLASRAVTRLAGWWGQDAVNAAESLSAIYEGLRDDPAVFARRAAGVLGRIPAFAIRDYHPLVRENRLARLLFERSLASWHDDAAAIANLVEAPEIHVQALAYRILGQPTPHAARAARDNLPVLIGTLLRPLHRRTRTLAFAALENAATDEEAARRIVARAREALDLPDVRYPKERLLGLIGRLLARWPGLRAPAERPVLYGAGA